MSVHPPVGGFQPCCLCGHHQGVQLGEMHSGRWIADEQGGLIRQEQPVPLVRCDACGHVQAGIHYDDAFLAGLYGTDPILKDDQPITGGIAALDFCAPIMPGRDGIFVDVGCGRGEILRLLRDRHGIKPDRLLGLDFRRLLPDGIPFRQADLNALGVVPELAGRPADLIFCTHVLEHVRHPRAFLGAVRAMLRPDGYLFIEVPDFGPTGAPPGQLSRLVLPQHIHYFTADSLDMVLRLSGFVPERRSDGGVLRVLARPTAVGATPVVVGCLAHVDEAHATLISQILAAVADGSPVGLWGVGLDLARLLEKSAPLAAAIAAGQVCLFDLIHAGSSLLGRELAHPDAIAAFPGPVWLVPSSNLIAVRMHEFARAAGWPPGRVIDHWRHVAIP